MPQKRAAALPHTSIDFSKRRRLKSVVTCTARAGSDISRIQRVCSARVISTQSRGIMLRSGLASHTLSMADSSGSLAMAPWGSGSTSSPVEIPGFVNHGTLAPGTADMLPMLVLSHSDHILKNGSKDGTELMFGKPSSPIFPHATVSYGA